MRRPLYVALFLLAAIFMVIRVTEWAAESGIETVLDHDMPTHHAAAE